MALMSIRFKEMVTVRFVALVQPFFLFVYFYLFIYLLLLLFMLHYEAPTVTYVIIFTHCSFIFQFRALSDQLYNTPENHKSVRRQIVTQVCCLSSYLHVA